MRKIILTIDSEQGRITLTNEKGDTYTSKSESLIDFLMGAESPSPSLQEAAEAMKKSLRPPDAEWVKNDLVHNGMHMWSLFPAHAFAILMAEFIADNNYEYDWHSHNTEFTMWNEVEDPQLHGEDGPEIITTNQLFIKFEKWVKEKYSEFISSFIAGWNAREAQQTGPILTRELYDTIWEAAQDRLAYDTADGKPFSYAPDKETFFTSLNP